VLAKSMTASGWSRLTAEAEAKQVKFVNVAFLPLPQGVPQSTGAKGITVPTTSWRLAMECRYANDERMSAQGRTLSKARERDKGVLRENRVV
jgi:hypothetical protein